LAAVGRLRGLLGVSGLGSLLGEYGGNLKKPEEGGVKAYFASPSQGKEKKAKVEQTTEEGKGKATSFPHARSGKSGVKSSTRRRRVCPKILRYVGFPEGEGGLQSGREYVKKRQLQLGSANFLISL